MPELVVIAGVAALVFGPKKLPEVGRSIGKTVKSFQQVIAFFLFLCFCFLFNLGFEVFNFRHGVIIFVGKFQSCVLVMGL